MIIAPSSSSTRGGCRSRLGGDARCGELRHRGAIDIDAKRHKRLSLVEDRLAKRVAVPAESLNLPEPGMFGDASVGVDVVREGMFGETHEEHVARDPALPRADPRRETEAGDFEDGWPLRDGTGDEKGKKRIEQRGPRGRQQTR